MHLFKRLGAVLVGLIVVAGGAAAPAQADSGFVPISKPSASGTPIAPPQKPVTAKPGQMSALATLYYSYAIAEDNQTATGMKADAQITKPWLSSLESHTLWEMATCHNVPTGRNCIELGWTIDNSQSSCVNGADTDKPHLFVGVWVDGDYTGYNDCSPYYHDDTSNNTIWAGISLNGAVGQSRHFRIWQNTTVPTQWDIVYGTGANGSTWLQRVGWIDTSSWSTPFAPDVNQWFGEVVGTSRTPDKECTDMLLGSPAVPTSTAGHLTDNMDLYGNVSPDDISTRVAPTGVGRGSVRVDFNTARMGGSGLC